MLFHSNILVCTNLIPFGMSLEFLKSYVKLSEIPDLTIKLRQYNTEICFGMTIHHPNVYVAMKMLVLSGEVLGAELTPRSLAIRRLLQPLT